MGFSIRQFVVVGLLCLCPWAWAGLSDDFKSPITTNAKWIALTGTALTLTVMATQDSISGPWETWTARNRPLGEASKYGDLMGQILPNALYAGGMWTAGFFGVEGAHPRAWLMAKASGYAGLITIVMKTTSGEGRPNNTERGSSFPSGHSATAFAFAGIVTAEHGWIYGTPAMLLAGFVAYSRINDNAHRLHDTIMGATIGLTAAYGIHYAQKPGEHPLQVWPVPLEGGGGLMARAAF